METIRPRFGSILEWLIAAAFIAAGIALIAVVLPHFQRVAAATPAPVPDPVPEVTLAVPPRAVSVPMLLFGDGRAVRIGDRLTDIVNRIGGSAQIGEDAIERAASGRNRLTRLYEYLGTRFALVFEPMDASSEPTVIGIYKQ
jgi:hypothetical protein